MSGLSLRINTSRSSVFYPSLQPIIINAAMDSAVDVSIDPITQQINVTVENVFFNNSAAYSDAVAALGFVPLNPNNNLSELTVATARNNLGLTALATQNPTAVNITGGLFDGIIGSRTANAANFTTINLTTAQAASVALLAPTNQAGAPVWRRVDFADLTINNATTARSALGISDLATQNSSGVNISNGIVDAIIGSRNPKAASFTTINLTAAQAASSVLIAPTNTGGTPTWRQLDFTDLTINSNANARLALNLGDLATQTSTAANITGGLFDGIIGSRTPNMGNFSTINLTTAQAASAVFTTPFAIGGLPIWRQLDVSDITNAAGINSPALLNATQTPSPLISDYSNLIATTKFVGDKLTALNIGLATGLATLDNAGRLTVAQIPTGIAAGVNYRGSYNAATNTPVISTGGGGGARGDSFYVAVAGTVAADSIGAVIVTDLINHNGTTWQRIPASLIYGNMAVQNANAITITGGIIAGLTSIALTNTDIWQPSLSPDLIWKLRDSSGNIALAIDYSGTLQATIANIASGNIGGVAFASGNITGVNNLTASGNLTATGTLTAGLASIAGLLTAGGITVSGAVTAGSFTSNSLILGGDNFASKSLLIPDWIFPLLDSSGNIISAYGSDGSFNATIGNFIALNTGAITGSNLALSGNAAITGNATVGGNLTIAGGLIVNNFTIANLNMNNGVISNTASYSLINADNWQSSLAPDLIWKLRDSSGNITLALDYAGNLFGIAANYTGSLTADTLIARNITASGALAVSGSFAPTSVSIAGDQFIAASILPDLIFPVLDNNGNVVSAYDTTGAFNVKMINVDSIKLQGQPLSSGSQTSVASDALDVTSSPYNAVGDAQEFWGYATISGSPANILTITNFTGLISLTQTSLTTATILINQVSHSGVAFQPYIEGKSIYLVIGSYILLAPIIKYIDGTHVLISASGVVPQVNQTGTITWPAFLPDRVGKFLVFDSLGQGAWWNNLSQKQIVTSLVNGTMAFITTISAVLAPNQIQITTIFPFAWNNYPAFIIWGSNNSQAVALAGQAALASGTRKLHFPGNGAAYLIPGIVPCSSSRTVYTTVPANDPNSALNAVIWQGDNVRTYMFDNGGLPIIKKAIPIGSDANRLCDRNIFGRASFKRCNNLNTINLFITGDSQANYNPQQHAAAFMQVHKFVEEFKRANAGKKINIYMMAIGGSTFASLNDPLTIIQNPILEVWTVPQPVVSGGISVYKFMLNANQTGVGPAILPDCVALFDNGGNDTYGVDGSAMFSLINRIKNISHADSFGPPDIILQTDLQGVIQVSKNGGAVILPDPMSSFWYYEYSAGLIRSAAIELGLPLIDLAPLVNRAIFGSDSQHRALRTVPSIPLTTATPTKPLFIPFRCQDFSFNLTMSGVTDGQTWSAMQGFDIKISTNAGNKVMLRQGINGNLWLGVSTYGLAVVAGCTITAGSNQLTLAAPTIFANQTFTSAAERRNIQLTSGIFNSSMLGQCLVTPTGNRGANGISGPQRNFIETILDSNNILVHDANFSNLDYLSIPNITLTLGAQFLPNDSSAQPDVVIFYPDGTIWNTQVAFGGYINNTQANLVDNAPQSLTNTSVNLFIGRMSVKWHDTGINLNALNTLGTLEVDVNRNSLIILYKYFNGAGFNLWFDVPIGRFGGSFYPSITPLNNQAMQLDNLWIDEEKPFMPSATAWEIRGTANDAVDYYLGGAGGHPASRLRTDVTDVFYLNQDLSTY